MNNESQRNEWPLSRIVEVYPDDTGFVRQVSLLTKDKQLLKRPISKIVLLVPVDDVESPPKEPKND